MEFVFAERGRNCPVGLDTENFSVLFIGWRIAGRGVLGAMSKWRKSFASLSVKYRV